MKKKTDVQKIGSLPLGYNDDDVVFIKNGKIYIRKSSEVAKEEKPSKTDKRKDDYV